MIGHMSIALYLRAHEILESDEESARNHIENNKGESTMKPKKEKTTEKKMTLKAAMQLFEKLDAESARTSDIVEGLNVILNSDDIAHMSRKGLYNALRFMGENLNRFS